ncbi:hypothetical protein C2G38_2163078 [Gigaspora rosea]|uniref:Uncharacterized protein n=1 Tax=Gigaspora rosea TaxID=44941 RepID=A0A397VYZ6_9GLOM|nr:hypothetical protein C2G38_2163078 [Gigaspora rosea]
MRSTESVNELYFVYNKALNTFDVKFIRKNIVEHKTNLKNLKQNIKLAQAENE